MKKEFEHREILEGIPNCPFGSEITESLELVRFMHDDDNDERNFKPVAFMPPFNRPQDNDRKRCQQYGLSFFTTIEAARKVFEKNLKIPAFAERIGDRIGKLKFRGGEGFESRKGSHCTVWKYKGIELLALVADKERASL